MNCSKCKNPIEDNSTVCEWCGAVLRKQNHLKTNNNIDRTELSKFPIALLLILPFSILVDIYIISVGFDNRYVSPNGLGLTDTSVFDTPVEDIILGVIFFVALIINISIINKIVVYVKRKKRK